jgi:hypothetical protein
MKLGISFYAYVHDRILAAHTISPLAELVTQAPLLALLWLSPSSTYPNDSTSSGEALDENLGVT